MSALTRAIVSRFAPLLALILGSPTAHAETLPRLTAMSMPRLVQLLREDAAVRRRFARDPEGVLREAAIDPAAFNLPPHIDEARLDRFLADWAGATGPSPLPGAGDARPVREAFTFFGEPAPVYGPPPRPLVEPPAPVYGPPASPVPEPPLPEPVPPPAPKERPPEPPSNVPAPAYGPPGGFRR